MWLDFILTGSHQPWNKLFHQPRVGRSYINQIVRPGMGEYNQDLNTCFESCVAFQLFIEMRYADKTNINHQIWYRVY